MTRVKPFWSRTLIISLLRCFYAELCVFCQ